MNSVWLYLTIVLPLMAQAVPVSVRAFDDRSNWMQPAIGTPSDVREIHALLDQYIGLYAKDTLPRWRGLFIPGFVASFTNDDGTVSTRTLDEFYKRQEGFFATGRRISEELKNVRVTSQGTLANVAADFVLHDNADVRQGRLALLLIKERDQLRIAALTFTYDPIGRSR